MMPTPRLLTPERISALWVLVDFSCWFVRTGRPQVVEVEILMLRKSLLQLTLPESFLLLIQLKYGLSE